MKLDPKEELILLQHKMDKLKKIIEEEASIFEIKTYTEVCNRLKIKELTIKDFSFLPELQGKKALALHKIANLELLFNSTWKKDWNNRSQYKWYPYYNINPSFRLVFFGSSYRYSCCFFNGGVGFYKDKETSDYVGKTFLNIYEDLM